MDAIAESAKEASHVDPSKPPPKPTIIRSHDRNALQALGLCIVGGQKKPLIE